jgi:uncharacterized protein
MKKSYIFLSALGILAITTVAILAVVMANKSDDQDRFLVNGSGTVYAKADIANINIGLKTEVKPSAAEATQENSKKMNEIIKILKELDIEAKDIKTSSYNLNPSYNWTEKDGRKLVGYEVYQNLTLKIRDLEKIGEIISKTTEKGANQVGNINFTIDDEYQLKNEARELAIEKAKEKAQIIAAQTGMKLGKIKGVSENSYSPVGIFDYTNARLEKDSVMESGEEAVSIESGQNEVKVEVTLIYEIK